MEQVQKSPAWEREKREADGGETRPIHCGHRSGFFKTSETVLTLRSLRLFKTQPLDTVQYLHSATQPYSNYRCLYSVFECVTMYIFVTDFNIIVDLPALCSFFSLFFAAVVVFMFPLWDEKRSSSTRTVKCQRAHVTATEHITSCWLLNCAIISRIQLFCLLPLVGPWVIKQQAHRLFRRTGLSAGKKRRIWNFSHVRDFQSSVVLNIHSLNVSMSKWKIIN